MSCGGGAVLKMNEESLKHTDTNLFIDAAVLPRHRISVKKQLGVSTKSHLR